jgi:hypothetical protein
MRIQTAFRSFVALALLFTVSPLLAQTAGEAELRVTVVDQTGLGIPTATVTLTPEGGQPVSVQSDERGLASLTALAAGAAKVRVEFAGFDPYVGTLTLRRGANTQTVTLQLGGLEEEVVVTASSAPEETRGAFVTTLEEEQIADLPDDPEELEAVLTQMAGGAGAVFQINGFRGGRLPAKDEIRMIRFRTSSFSADNHDAGRTQVEIFTRPAAQTWGGSANVTMRGDTLNARNALAQVETPEQNRRAGFSLRGPLTSKTSVRFSTDGTNGFNSSTIVAVDAFGNRLGDYARQPFEQRNLMAGIEHALTANQTLRLEYRHGESSSSNQGVGDFNLAERASERSSSDDQVRVQVQGLVGKATLNELRVQFNARRNEASSASSAPSIIVMDAFSAGGAGIASQGTSRTFEIADNLDFTMWRNHQMRVGLLLEGGLYGNFDARNAAGTFTFASLEAYEANQPLQFTQRIGVVDTSFSQYQFGVYFQDDFRVNRMLSLSLGVRNEMQSHVNDRLNLMPRVGFTLTPWGSQTSIRGGYGIFNDWYDSSLYDQTLRVNGIAQRDLLILNPGYPDPFLGTDPIVLPSGRIQADPNLKLPYVHQASIGHERQLWPNLTMQASYEMLRGRNQLRARNVNAPVDGVRPEPGVGNVTQFESTGRSSSDRLRLQTNIRMPQRRMFMNVNYTLGQLKNHADSATSLPADSLSPDSEWGPSAQDVRHQLSATANVPLIYGLRSTWQVQARSGAAYTMTTGRDDNLDGVVNDRPEGVGRNTLRAEPTWDLGLRIARAFGFGGTRAQPAAQPGGQGRGNGAADGSRYSVELFANATNVLNHVNHLGYSGNILSPFFGLPTRAGQARRVEIGMQFRF